MVIENILSTGLVEQNNISNLSDSILHYYSTDMNEKASNVAKEILSVIDNSNDNDESLATIDRLSDELLEIRITLLKDSVMFEQLMNMNLFYRTRISDGIKMLEEELEKNDNDNEFYTRSSLEKRIEDLRLTCVVSEQMDHQIRLLLTNNQKTVSAIENTAFTTVTLWKNRLLLETSRKNLNLQGEY